MTNPFAKIALRLAETYARTPSELTRQQQMTVLPKSVLYIIGTTLLTTILYKSSSKIPTLFKYFYYKFQPQREIITAPVVFEDKYFKEYDEWLLKPSFQDEAIKKERLENMYYSTVKETINDFYGDIIMCYDHATFSFAYYARTANIPYKYLETISRKYMIETDAPREIHVDIREEYKKAKDKISTTHLNKSSTTSTTPTTTTTPTTPTDNSTLRTETSGTDVFVKLKSYNTASNLNLHTTTNDTKEKTHKFATPDPKTNEETSSTVVIRENANRYSYRGKLSDFEEHHKTFLAERRKASTTTTTTTTTTTPAAATTNYAEFKKQMLQRSAL